MRKSRKAQESLTGGIFVDNFAGGGGASTGLETGLGITVAAAINHDPAAILCNEESYSPLGNLLFDTAEEAAEAWNRRADNG